MRNWFVHAMGVLAIAGLLAPTFGAEAETGTLEMKIIQGNDYDPATYMFSSTSSQSFMRQASTARVRVAPSNPPDLAIFEENVKKEPKYNTDQPFRGAATFGDSQVLFAFDTSVVPEKEDAEAEGDEAAAKEKKKGPSMLDIMARAVGAETPTDEPEAAKDVVAYDLLYVDLDGDGDLAEETPIEASNSTSRATDSYSYSSTMFDAVELKIEVDGKKLDYAFRTRVYSNSQPSFAYSSASFSSAAYRDGEIEINGEKKRVVLVDFNSNGRFDDAFSIQQIPNGATTRIYPQYGDMLYIDPEAGVGYRNPYDAASNPDQFQVASLINLDGAYYDLSIEPSGESLTITPSDEPLGRVTNPNGQFEAIIYNDDGVLLEIVGDEAGEATVPAGDWKLLSYTLRKSGAEPDAEEDDKPKPSLLGAISRAITDAAPTPAAVKITHVSARADSGYEPVEVVVGETVEMPFGPPFKPIVTAPYASGDNTVQLQMSLVGAAGEECSDLMVNGRRPESPKFTITNEDGEEIYSGSFEYG